MAPLRNTGELVGLRDFSAHYCGQSAALGYSATAAQLTKNLASEARRRCNWMTGLKPETNVEERV